MTTPTLVLVRTDVDFGLLGPLEVHDDGRRIEIAGRQVRRLLAALLLAPNAVVSVDRLYEVLWGAQPPPSAANTLQTHVHHLRDALEPGRRRREPGRFVLQRVPGYLLSVDPGQIDAARFRDLADRGRRSLVEAPDEAAALLHDGLALWRGEPLADFAFDLFAQAAIVELTELRLQALEHRIDAELVLGRHDALAVDLLELVREQPLRERLWAQLMVCHYRCGRQAEALATFARVRDVLVDELGVEPGPLIGRLHHAILNQHPVLDWPPPAEAGRRTVTAGTQPPSSARRADAVPAPARVHDAMDADLRREALEALQRRNWARAYAALSSADASSTLDGEALDALAESAMWLGEYETSLSARQRAHAAFFEQGDTRRAAMTAIALALHFAARLRGAVAAGWYGRAERLLADEPEGPEGGYLAWTAALMSIGARRYQPALDAARRTLEIGLRTEDQTLQALGLTFQGYLIVRRGDLDRGLRMLDEGMATAVSGAVAPFPTSIIFCRMIDTCQLLGDFRRAGEWLEAIEASPITACITSYPGDCDTHRTQVLVGRGAWVEAERLARQACAEVEKFDVGHAGLAFYELGEVCLRTGDLDAAAAAFERAAELGTVPQPGAANLDRRTGHTARAAETIATALADEPWDDLARARLLPTAAELALEIRDLQRAREAAAELAALADTYPSRAMAAAAAGATGGIHLAEGDADAAAAAFRDSRRAWDEAGAPYEAARARAMLARALVADRRPAEAATQLSMARTTFERLGAAPDLQTVDELLVHVAPVDATSADGS